MCLVAETAMNTRARPFLHWLLIVIGLVLMVGGVVTDKYGASVVGLIVAAINIQQLLSLRKVASKTPNERPR
jgi:hypothetical protein